MFPHPAIEDNEDLGLTESVFDGNVITDNRTEGREYPFIEPRENAPHDDANRINHALKKIDTDIDNLFMADILGLPPFLLS